MNNTDFDILIIGAGVVGLTAAIALAQKGFQVAIFDKHFPVLASVWPGNSRVYAINAHSKQLWQDLGIWQYLDQKRIAPYRKMHIWDGKTKEVIDFDAKLIAAATLGCIIDDATIKQALLQVIQQTPQITCFSDHTLTKLTETDLSIRVAASEIEWQGRLLILAEGRNATLAQQLGVQWVSEDYQQSAITATVATEKSMDHTAFQVFLSEGPLAFLPQVDPHHASIVWTNSKNTANQLKKEDKTTFENALNFASQGQLGRITLLSERQTFPLRMQHAKHYVGKHWLLMGDVAHTIHPLAGLGLNLGLQDVSAFLRQINSSPSKPFSAKILRSYQRERKFTVNKTIMVTSGLNSLFKLQFPPMVFLRGLGLYVGNRWLEFKRYLIQEAKG